MTISATVMNRPLQGFGIPWSIAISFLLNLFPSY